MKKEKTVNVSSSFRQLYLYEKPILENISKELLLDVGFEPEKIEEEIVYDFLLKSITSRHNVNFRLLSQKFTEKDVYGVLVKNTRDVSLVYKIGNLFFSKTGKLGSLIENTLLYNTFYRNYLVFNLGSFGVLQAHDNNLSNNALKKFLNVSYGLNTEKLDLYNVQRIYGLQSDSQCAVIIFDYKGYGSKYYECKIVTKNNNFVFPVSSLPRYTYSFNLINYLWRSKNFTGKDTVFHKYIVENREDFITNVNKIIQDEISAEEFLMRFYV